MRILGWTLLATAAAASAALAQVGAPAAGQENLDTVLHGWEKGMTELKSFYVLIERTSIDKALNARDEFKGYAMFVKAPPKQTGSRARLELNKVNNAQVYEKYICTGTYLYEFAPASNTVRVHNMPQNKGGPDQSESFLSFLFGMGAEQAKTRYHMDHIVPNPPDKFYHYIRVRPKLDQDKADFTEARLSLLRTNMLPAQVWYHHANGKEITWNFTKHQVDVDIPATYFQPDVPPGWKMQRVDPKGPIAPGQGPQQPDPKVRNKP
jgi:TIGR03009 family protein